MKKACVIGWPIAHSRSPLIHNYWLKQIGIDGIYDRKPVEPSALKSFLERLEGDGYAGCNVTIPHKETVFQLVEPADENTRRLAAVNTVYFRENILLGTNTDGEGFLGNLLATKPRAELKGTKAVILGAGGAATAIIGALVASGVTEIAVANRSRERTEKLRHQFGDIIHPVGWEHREDILSDCNLLVNTTALGMIGQPPLDIDLARLPESAIVYDIVYSPLVTPLLIAARRRGNPVVDGLGMLLHQAVRGFELWFGKRPDVTVELHDLVARDIDPAYRR